MEGREKPLVDKYMDIVNGWNYDGSCVHWITFSFGPSVTWFMLQRVYIQFVVTPMWMLTSRWHFLLSSFTSCNSVPVPYWNAVAHLLDTAALYKYRCGVCVMRVYSILTCIWRDQG